MNDDPPYSGPADPPCALVRFTNDGRSVWIDPWKVSVISPSGDYLMYTTLVVEGQQVVVDEDSDTAERIVRTGKQQQRADGTTSTGTASLDARTLTAGGQPSPGAGRPAWDRIRVSGPTLAQHVAASARPSTLSAEDFRRRMQGTIRMASWESQEGDR